MTQANEAQKAISELNGTDLHGRKLSVSEARPKASREAVVAASGSRKSGRRNGW
jgi:RNA recognition motif-containing protein